MRFIPKIMFALAFLAFLAMIGRYYVGNSTITIDPTNDVLGDVSNDGLNEESANDEVQIGWSNENVDLEPSSDSNGLIARLESPSQTVELERSTLDISEPLASKYDRLVLNAFDGDADSAFELARSLAECFTAPRDPDQLHQLINFTYQTRRIEGNAFPIDDLEDEIERINNRYQYCLDIDSEQTLDHFIFMKKAAENGSLEAKIELLNYAGLPNDARAVGYARAWTTDEERIQDVVRHLQDAAAAGSAEATFILGSRAAEVPELFTSIEQAAYAMAGAQIMVASGRDHGQPELFLGVIRRTYMGLGPGDAEAALELANELIGSDRCCFFIGRKQKLGESK